MLTRRVIVCLDVKGGRVVKGVRFRSLRDVGDPVALAEHYEEQGADELVFLDISASVEERSTLLDVARRTAERLFVPLTIGGGVRTVDEIAAALRAGADKVSLNTAAVHRPTLLSEAAERFGSQCVVASIDAGQAEDANGSRRWHVHTHGGTVPTPLDAVHWARECVRLGAGEILLTSIDRDGGRGGYDLELTRAIVHAVPVPVIASGGAGSPEHVWQVLREEQGEGEGGGSADAALVAGILHDGVTTVARIKQLLAERGVPVRRVA